MRHVDLAVGPFFATALPPQTIGETMKTLKATCAALMIALLLSIPAYSEPGDGHSPGSPAAAPIASPTPVTTAATAIKESAVGDEPGLVTFADVLWAIASIY